MTTWQVIVPDRTADAEVEQAVFGDAARVTTLGARGNAELAGRIEDADAILAWHDLRWDAATLGALRRCKVLVRIGVGFDNVDLDAARARGIVVCNVPDYGTHDVADHALALLLALARGLPGHERAVRGDTWRWGVTPTFRLTDRMLGIVGLGRIGAATALRAKAFGLRVGFYDPYRPEGWDKTLGLTRFYSLADLARASDVVSLHVPLTAETRGMIGSAFFEAARPGLVLVNTARGPVVDWPAFTTAFEAGRIASAGFDVLPDEPLDRTDPLLARWLAEDPAVRDRLVITPHCAFYSLDAMIEMRRKAAEEALRVLRGEPPRNRVG
ncbi:MAG: C-terminal binding protein [Deltaproteobacteria bacterium]|nr:C-terminal binding protein [Deltaproteobacteria bacterium]